MQNKIIKDKYIQSSGWLRLFFRKEGTPYFRAQGTPYEVCYRGLHTIFIQTKDAYIVQFEGNPDFDSGYNAHEFDTLADALAYWNDEE